MFTTYHFFGDVTLIRKIYLNGDNTLKQVNYKIRAPISPAMILLLKQKEETYHDIQSTLEAHMTRIFTASEYGSSSFNRLVRTPDRRNSDDGCITIRWIKQEKFDSAERCKFLVGKVKQFQANINNGKFP